MSDFEAFILNLIHTLDFVREVQNKQLYIQNFIWSICPFAMSFVRLALPPIDIDSFLTILKFKTMKKIILVLISLSVLNTITSCKKNKFDQTEQINVTRKNVYSNSQNDVYVNNNGILVFKTIKALENSLNEIAKSKANHDAFFASLNNFVSMKQIFDELNKQEEKELEKVSQMALRNTTNRADYLFLPEYAKKYRNVVSIKKMENSEYCYDMNLSNNEFAEIINSEGVVYVEGIEYQFTKDYVRIINGNEIINVKPSEFHLGISNNNVHPARIGTSISSGIANYCSNSWSVSSDSYITNQKRVSMMISFNQYNDPINNYNVTSFKVGFVSLKKRIIGIWISITPDDVVVYGAFSGPRSPIASDGLNSGYVYSNPFTVHTTSTVTHYTDYSSIYKTCYTMDNYLYYVRAYHDNDQITAVIEL